MVRGSGLTPLASPTITSDGVVWCHTTSDGVVWCLNGSEDIIIAQARAYIYAFAVRTAAWSGWPYILHFKWHYFSVIRFC